MDDALLTEIATQNFRLSTLETRHSDELDFHSVAVWSIRAALRSAYLAGYAASMRAVRGKETPLPTEHHTMIHGVWLGQGEAADVSDDRQAETIETLHIHEVELLASRDTERLACDVLIPAAIRQRRIG